MIPVVQIDSSSVCVDGCPLILLSVHPYACARAWSWCLYTLATITIQEFYLRVTRGDRQYQ